MLVCPVHELLNVTLRFVEQIQLVDAFLQCPHKPPEPRRFFPILYEFPDELGPSFLSCCSLSFFFFPSSLFRPLPIPFLGLLSVSLDGGCPDREPNNKIPDAILHSLEFSIRPSASDRAHEMRQVVYAKLQLAAESVVPFGGHPAILFFRSSKDVGQAVYDFQKTKLDRFPVHTQRQSCAFFLWPADAVSSRLNGKKECIHDPESTS